MAPPTRSLAGMDPSDRDRAAADAARALREGGIVVLPTETVYGLFTAATPASVDRLDEMTGVTRPTDADPRSTLHAPDPGMIREHLDLPSAVSRRLFDRLTPGPIRLVLEQGEPALASLRGSLGLEAGVVDRDGHLSVRFPNHPVTRRVLRDAGVPCVARKLGAAVWAIGDDPGASTGVIPPNADPAPDVVIDDGRTLREVASTTVRIALSGKLSVDPGGALDEREVLGNLERTVLFVCTGNTCRSPMAERLAAKIDSENPHEGITTRFMSAGIAAGPGMDATPEAVEVLGDQGIDLSDHRSRGLTPQLIDQAEVVYAMTPSHAEAVMHAAPDAAHKVFPLGEAEVVEDPIGRSKDIYRKTASQIERLIRARLEEIAP